MASKVLDIGGYTLHAIEGGDISVCQSDKVYVNNDEVAYFTPDEEAQILDWLLERKAEKEQGVSEDDYRARNTKTLAREGVIRSDDDEGRQLRDSDVVILGGSRQRAGEEEVRQQLDAIGLAYSIVQCDRQNSGISGLNRDLANTLIEQCLRKAIGKTNEPNTPRE